MGQLGLGFHTFTKSSSHSKMPSFNPPILHRLLFLLTLSLLLAFARSDRQEDAICPLSSKASVSDSCAVRCFRPDPVCGVDGVTYWCGCPDAACAGVRVAKRGACQVGSGGSGQAFLLVHIAWLILLGFSALCGFL